MRISIGHSVEGENFFDRERELNRLEELFIQDYANAFIPGPRRIGKTSLVREFIRLHKERYKFIYFDLEGRYSIIELCKDLMKEIDSAFPGFIKSKGNLKERWNTVTHMISEIEIGGVIKVKTGELQETIKEVTREMEEIFAELYRQDFIFAFDEFSDFLLNLKKNSIEEVKFFLEWLRRLRQQRKIRVIITGSINIISTVEELSFLHLLNDITDIELFSLSRDKVGKLLAELLLDKRIVLGDAVMDFAVEKLSDGIPFYVQLFADSVRSYAEAGQAIEDLNDMENIYKQMTGKQHKEFSDLHHRLKSHLSGPEFNAAKKILAHTCWKPMSFDDLYPYVEEVLPDKAAVNKLLRRLMDECYLKKIEGYYSFVSPMLADWWKNHFEWER